MLEKNISLSVEKAFEKWSNRHENLILLDVREQDEYDIVHVKGSILVPLSIFMDKLNKLKEDEKNFNKYLQKEYLVLCKMGSRSLRASKILLENGFTKVYNIEGGINAWAKRVDNTLSTY